VFINHNLAENVCLSQGIPTYNNYGARLRSLKCQPRTTYSLQRLI